MLYDLYGWLLFNFNFIGPYFLKFLVKTDTSGQMSGSLGSFAHLRVFLDKLLYRYTSIAHILICFKTLWNKPNLNQKLSKPYVCVKHPLSINDS